MGKFHIGMAVAYNKRALQIQFQFLSGLLQHSCSWFPAGAAIRRHVRTIIHAIQLRAGCMQFRGKTLVNISHKLLRKISTPNAGLIGHNNYRERRFVQSPNCFRRSVQQTEAAQVIQIAHLFGNGSVAIQKNRRM